jgi:hypothetical protein
MRTQLAVSAACIVMHKRKFDCPIVGKIEWAPFGVVKTGLGKRELAGLGKVALTKAKSKVFHGVVAVAEHKLPAEIEE